MGDKFNFSGDFRGANVNIKSTLRNVHQSAGMIPGASDDEQRAFGAGRRCLLLGVQAGELTKDGRGQGLLPRLTARVCAVAGSLSVSSKKRAQ